MHFVAHFLLLALSIVNSDNDAYNDRSSADILGSALNGYVAILDRAAKIYQIMTHQQPVSYFQTLSKNCNGSYSLFVCMICIYLLQLNNHHSEHFTSQNPKAALFERYAESRGPINDDYYFPLIDDVFGFNKPTEEEIAASMKSDNKNKKDQHEYIRRRLKEEEHDDIVCNNNTEESPYASDYKFVFQPFAQCTPSSNFTRSLSSSFSNTLNEAILYSPNCLYMLIVNGISGKLQVIESQQTLPLWSSTVSNTTAISSDELSLMFDSQSGDLSVVNGAATVWSSSQSAHWVDGGTKAPFSVMMDNSGTLFIKDSDGDNRWYSDYYSDSAGISNRQMVYNIDLMDDDGNTAYSMMMEVFLLLHSEQHFYLYFQYVTPSGALSEEEQHFVDLMTHTRYRWNVSVYELSTMPVGDHFVIYDPDLPMIYTLGNGNSSQRLSISESYTFLCMDNDTKQFNIEILPFQYTLPLTDNATTYTLSLSPMVDSEYVYNGNDGNYTMEVAPWNPCNEGRPVLAQNANRECFVQYDLKSALSKYSAYSDNAAYSNVEMQYIFKSPQCANASIQSHNATVTVSSCQEMGSDFESAQCEAVRAECDGYFEICLDFTSSLCTCLCPRDKQGVHCEKYRNYECTLNILNANMTECEMMTQSDLNKHGRSDYDVTIDGDKPCFFIPDDDESFIDSTVQLQCAFTDSNSGSKVWEDLLDYDIDDEGVTFAYCLGNETSTFALTRSPPTSYLRLKIFNFARIFSDDETYIIPLDINHWSGDKYVHHSRAMGDLADEFKTGGRVYIEYQLWQRDEHGQEQRISVERRFYDIDHWQMPPLKGSKLSSAQKWSIAFFVLFIVGTLGCVTWKCNRWCKKLEHEKTD